MGRHADTSIANNSKIAQMTGHSQGLKLDSTRTKRPSHDAAQLGTTSTPPVSLAPPAARGAVTGTQYRMIRSAQAPGSALDLTLGIRGRTALVTGGSRGIGRSCVELLLAHGARVAFTYNKSCREAQEILDRWPNRAYALHLDLQDPRSVASCFEEFEHRCGQLHMLINNAAVDSSTVGDYESDSRRWDGAVLQINAQGALLVAQAALPIMQRHASADHGKLVNVASVCGLQAFPAMRLSDNMSKTAMVAMSQQLAAQFSQAPIDVFTVCPGATDTRMFQRSALDKLTGEARTRIVRRLPKGRLIHPDEVARVILFLCSAWSTVLHGAVLDCSMGLRLPPGVMSGADY